MAEKYYLLSKNCGDGPYFIGVLERLSKGRYRFKYAFSGEMFPRFFMRIPGLDDPNLEYFDDDVVHGILERVVFEPTHMFIRLFMDTYGLGNISIEEYDPWDALTAMCEDWKKTHPADDIWPMRDCRQLLYFYESLPREVNRFDEIADQQQRM